MTQILLTRPLAQSHRFADSLGAGYTAEISPLLEINYRDGPVETGAARAVVFTSSNGIHGWVQRGGATILPAWCVGQRTAELAQQAGFHVHGYAANLRALAQCLDTQTHGPLLHIRGKHVSTELSSLLPTRIVETCIVYEAVAHPLTQRAIAGLQQGRFDAIPIFSPRTAHRLVAAYQPEWHLGETRILAISDAAAQVLNTLPAKTIETALSPNSASVLALLRRSSAQ